MAQETWIVASLSNNFDSLDDLKSKLVEEGQECLLSTSNSKYMADKAVFYDENPVKAFQNLLNSLDRFKSYKLVIKAHGQIVNGKHVLMTSNDISAPQNTLISSADLLNIINAQMKISETLFVSCYGGFVHKDLNPSSNQIYTISHPGSPVGTSIEVFRKEDKISTIKDLVISISAANIKYGGDDTILEGIEEHLIDMHLPYDISGLHTIYAICSKDGRSQVFYTGKTEEINEDALSSTLGSVPLGERYDCLEKDFRKYLLDEEFPEGAYDLLFQELRTHYSLISNSTKEIKVEQDLLNNGFPVDIDKEDDLLPSFIQDALPFLNRFDKTFDVKKKNYTTFPKFVEIMQKEYIQLAMEFIPHQDGYQFVILFCVVTRDNISANFASISKQVDQNFKNNFFSELSLEEILQSAGANFDNLSEDEIEIMNHLKASRYIMKTINHLAEPLFSSIQEAVVSCIMQLGIFINDEVEEELEETNPSGQDVVSTLELLSPINISDLFANSERTEIEVGEILFAQVTGEIYDWVSNLTE